MGFLQSATESSNDVDEEEEENKDNIANNIVNTNVDKYDKCDFGLGME